jgi:hypothetical protein
MDSDVCASSSASEQNAPLEIMLTPAAKGDSDLVRDEKEEAEEEEGKTEDHVIKYNADKNSETHQSKMS